jgi:hypothetical protein
MTFATNSDLLKYYTTVMDHGVVDWSAEIAEAQGDIENIVKAKWFFVEFGSQRTRGMVIQPIFNPDLLVPAQWNKAVCYRALANYILPKLSTFRPEGDAFQKAVDFYDQRFDEEMDLQLSVGVQYDLNNDHTISEAEKFPTLTNRLYR